MIDLLINRTPRNTSIDIHLAAQQPDIGDVVMATCPDADGNNWAWGIGELTQPQWRILRLTDRDISETSTLLSAEVPTQAVAEAQAAGQSVILQYRGWQLNAGAVTDPALTAWFNDDTRAQPIYSLALGGPLSSIVVQHAHIVDPVSGV